MTRKKATDLIGKNEKWLKEAAKISANGELRSTQIAFDFNLDIDTALRLAAAKRHITPSAIVREHLGLPIAEPTRKRISLSFTDVELNELATRYKLSRDDKAKIKNRISDEIGALFSNGQGADDELLSTTAELVRAQKSLQDIKAELDCLRSSSHKIKATIDAFYTNGGDSEQ
jgi:hypothetical protein